MSLKLLLICGLALLAGCALNARTVMPISEVVAISRGAGTPDQALARVRAGRTSYALRGSDFGRLAHEGVPPPVLDHLQQEFVNDVDLQTRYWVLGERLGGCDACYPQPLDLSTLATGGNGMAPAQGLGMQYSFARPAGVPDWIPSSPGTFRAPALTVAEVADMARRGVPESEMVLRVQNSYLDNLIATGGLRLSTHLEAGLKGSELAALSGEGVPDAVLDALQAKFLAQWIEFARIRYQNLGKGSIQSRLF